MPPTTCVTKKRNRRRLGARSYKNYSEDMLLLAVDLVKNKNSTSYDAEKQFGIPRRTIEKRVKMLHSDKPGPRFRLNQEEEQKIIKVLIAAGDFGYPLSRLDLKLAVYDYLKKNNKTYVFDDKVPGDWWVKHFLERHKDKLTLRSVQNITKARAGKSLEEFKDYFKNLENSVKNVPPKNIMNYDETNVSDDPGSSKCIFRRGVKYPERIMNHSKGCISVMFAGTADGDLLPPYVVYKSENLWTEWCRDGPEGARYNRTKSGWFDSVVFMDWFTNIVIPWAKQLEGPKLVIGDNLSSHLNPDVVDLCEAYQIRFVFLPPQSTQITQPLDVAFFGPLKKSWRKILLQYKTENPKQASLNKSHFPLLLKQLMDAANIKKQNLVRGFKTTGIYPFNPYEVFKKLPEYEDEIKYDVDQTILDYLKENKNPNPIKRGKNTKLNVPSGKSVSSVDISAIKQKTTMKRNTTVETSQETVTERIQEPISEMKRRKIEQLPTKTLNKKADIKQKIVKKNKTRVESSSDSESSCVIPYSDTSEYDPRCDEDEEIENEIMVTYYDTNLKDQSMKQEETREVQNMKKNEEKIVFGINHDKVLKGQNIENSNEESIGSKDNKKLLKVEKEKKYEKMVGKADSDETNKEISCEFNIKKSSQNLKTKVTVLSDIKNTAENQAYFDLSRYGPISLKAVNTKYTVKAKSETARTIKIECSKLLKPDKTEPISRTKPLSHNMSANSELGAGCSKEPEKKAPQSYNVNDYILVRYILKKKVQYFVGKIYAKLENSYQVSFLKQSGRNDNTKFTQPKKKDIDTINEEMIVKEVQLMSLNEHETEFVFLEDDDLVYFD